MPGIRLGRAGVGLYRAFTGSVIPPGFYLEAIPTTDTTGTSGVISQLYTNLTGTLTYSKVSGDARISINASTGEISTSAPIYLTDSATFIAKALDTVSGTYIEAPITLVGSVAGFVPGSWASAIEWWDASDGSTVFSNSSATTSAVAGSSVAAAIVGKKAGIVLSNSTSGTQPDYVTDANGNKALDFNRASVDRLTSTNTSLITNMTGDDNAYAIIGRFKRGPADGSVTPVAASRTSGAVTHIRHFFGGSNTVGVQRQIVNDALTVPSVSTPVNLDKWYTVSWLFSGTTITVRVDGVVVIDNAACNSNTITVDTFSIGALYDAAASSWAGISAFDGRFGEMFVCEALSASDPDIVAAENYLTAKWPN